MHLSTEKPIIRRIPYIKRGADFEMSSVTCFVATKTYDQDEGGDTLTHTFIVDPIVYGQDYYFYFTATHGGAPSASISQIFHANCPVPTVVPETVKIYSAPSAGGVSCDCQLQRYGRKEYWPAIHDGVGTQCYCGYLNIPVGMTTGSRWPYWKYMYRMKVTHDLAIIPVGSTIQAVSYHFKLLSKQNTCGGGPSVALYELPSPYYHTCSVSDYQKCGSTKISNQILWADLTPGAFHELVIDPAYFSLFVPGAKSVFSVREASYDGPNIASPWWYYCYNVLQIQAVDTAGEASDPYLEITYMPP